MAAGTHEMTIAETGMPGEVLPEHGVGPRSFAWWGMVWLIATEATLFALLLASYFYLRFRSPHWPPEPIEPPELMLPLIMTAILWSSSIPVHIAEKGIEKGNQGRLRWGLALGWLLGATFFVMTVGIEWPETLHSHFTPRTNAYGSMFFTVTGFHLSHVLVGLSVSAFTQVRAWQGAFDEKKHVSVQNFAMYWHFVDIVWLFVLLSIYVSPHF